MDDRKLTPKEVRKLIREEKITGQTSGLCPGYAQANLLILPKGSSKINQRRKDHRSDFRLVSGICTGKSSDPSQRSGL